MSVSADLREEVVGRMASLGVGRAHTASVISRHGEQRSLGATWAALEELWAAGRVEWMGEDRYLLRRRVIHVAARDEQLRIGEAR